MTSVSDHSRKNVLFFIGSLGGGGAERQTIEILKRIDRHRFRPVLYLHHRAGPFLDEVPQDVPVYSLWSKWSWRFRAKWHLIKGDFAEVKARQFSSLVQRESIDLVFDQTYLATLHAAQACRMTPVARISTCVADPLEEIRLYASGDLDEAISQATLAYSQADRVLAVSQGLRQRLIMDLNIPPEKIEVQYNLLDSDEAIRQSAQPLAESVRTCFTQTRFHLLTVGRLSAEKGHRFLLEAVNQLVHREKQEHLLWHVVGTGPLEAELKNQVIELGLEEHVRFHGFQKNPFPFYRHSHLFCLPSVHEAFGCVLTEAMACGLPVLATDCPSGPKEVLGDGQYGQLVSPGDSRQLAKAILEHLAAPDLVRQKALGAAQFVRETFSPEVNIPRLENLMSDVIRDFEMSDRQVM